MYSTSSGQSGGFWCSTGAGIIHEIFSNDLDCTGAANAAPSESSSSDRVSVGNGFCDWQT